ncbi:MAG: alpha-2-macroglobulin [Gemmatales bacterium]|nr:MAG: alpha-2-macroglobulin [Gemmatales bacterium]
MVKKRLVGILLVLLLTASAATYWLSAADEAPTDSRRAELMKLYGDGNYKEAYQGLRQFVLNPKNDPSKVVNDFNTAVQCLRQLGRVDEVDDFREAAVTVHAKNWRLLRAVGESYANDPHHFGYIIAGKFSRGHHRGGGRYVNTMLRDRVRALQLMDQARKLISDQDDSREIANFYLSYAHVLLYGAGYHAPWRLQYLTNLQELPDYNEYWGGGAQGAPVDADGKPVFHHLPKSFDDAKSDGERWRWLLTQVVEHDPKRANEVDTMFAEFLRNQFGVQTMAWYAFRGGWSDEDDDKKNESGTYALHTLKDTETIARLANGIKRFELPDEFNFIKIYERIANRGKSSYGEQARDQLASIYENRRQYDKAAAVWKKAIEEYGPGADSYRQKRLDQIVGNWGRFEYMASQPAGKPVVVDFRFRNGEHVTFEAHEIKVPLLLEDVKQYLKSNPPRLRWEKVNIGNIGYRLVQLGENRYLGNKVATWTRKLKPRPKHYDKRITVETPLRQPGAYLLTAKMANGNTSRIVIWVSNTVIAQKQLDGENLYYLADAVTGLPIPNAKLEFFGYRLDQIPNTRTYKVTTDEFTETTDANGLVRVGNGKMSNNFQWLITSKKDRQGAERFAYLGFQGVWFGRQYDPEYNQTKVFTITDRPVYRPRQTVQFKFWIRHAKYDQPDQSRFANMNFPVEIRNPKGEKVFAKNFTTDAYGGIAGEFTLPSDATLGVYRLYIPNRGGGSFRVEEYKKPEFEVKVEAPKEPVKLGEKISAKIVANYYFGAPVTSATVKYKVMRTSHRNTWYPYGRWDWFYGPGYWWFAEDYFWYPRFAEWCGCFRPVPWWIGHHHVPPEIVLENEVPIGPDGSVDVEIDTQIAKELHGDTDHQYTITAEVVDESRRTIVGTGNVLVTRKPFKVYTWLDRGHYRVGDTIKASFSAQTPDHQPVQGKGILKLLAISYDENNQPVEKEVRSWNLDTNVEGNAHQQIAASKAGQYRLSYRLTDAKGHTIEGGYIFVIRGEGFDGRQFRFDDLELITDKREYKPGEKVKLMINTNRADGAVLLFIRPTNGVYLPPKLIRLKGKSTEEEIAVVQRDMPNFFIEAMTIADAKVHTETREVVVPPEKRILNVDVVPSLKEYKPGQQATVKVKLTDAAGNPFVGSVVLSVYDKSVEYISGGSNVPEIKAFFWKWRRHHYSRTYSSLNRGSGNLVRPNETPMQNLGVFGEQVADELEFDQKENRNRAARDDAPLNDAAAQGFGKAGNAPPPAAPMAAKRGILKEVQEQQAGGQDQPPGIEPVVRKNFADTAFWSANLTTDQNGITEVTFKMPENLTGWKVKAWAMGHGTKVGHGEAEVVTKKNLLVRLQAPRFFVQKDEVVLSANVHNYLKSDKEVTVSLEVNDGVLFPLDKRVHRVTIPANGEKRIDWRVRVENEGEALVRMKAISDEESDAMEMRFPAYVHGILKMDSYSGVIRPDNDSAVVVYTVPEERRINQSRLEVRYSPTLAGAMVDALPYLVDYPYGCTEQTLNRFLPTVITLRILQRMNLDLKEIENKRTNLNAQEIGEDKERAKGWKRYERNPVFNEEEVRRMAQAGVNRLASMQVSDGGWGWFSGWGERSYPHTTAVVVHGLQVAVANDITLPPNMLERGIQWLRNYQNEQVRRIKNAPNKIQPWKEHADNLDAFVYMVLVDAHIDNAEMRDFLYRDRTKLAVYAKAMFGLALHKMQQKDKLAMILRNIEQYVVEDDENQTAYLRLPADNYWWYWYGSEIEANGYYLKLLAKTNPKDRKASRLVKYLLNNRKHATYWNSTRDTAVCIEAMADYIVASGEDKPDMTVEVWLDGKKQKEVKIDSKNLFTFENKFVLIGDAVESGKHKLEIKRKGKGPVYFNAYVTNFTLEDFITKAGLEVKVNRKYYKLTRVDKKIKVTGSRGQALDQKIEKYERTELKNWAELKSGDLVEVELEIDSKNDYEYLIFEDPKAAGFEPMLVRSGYNANDLGAYMELRDDRVCFFVRQLARGKHSVSYRLRAEIPGKFSALPTRGYAMYAPELKGNSDEIKLIIED